MLLYKKGHRMRCLITRLLFAPLLSGVLSVAFAQMEPRELTAASGHVDKKTVKGLVQSPVFKEFLSSLQLQSTGAIRLPFSGIPESVGGPSNGNGSSRPNPDLSRCISISGSPQDGIDRDGIPLSFRQDFNCDGISSASGTSDLIGFYEVVDKDDTKYGALGGFSFKFNLSFNEAIRQRRNQGAFSGWIDATPTDTSFIFDRAYSYESDLISMARPATSGQLKFQNQMITVYEPRDMANPWRSGAMTTTGYSGFSGLFYNTAAQSVEPVNFVFQVEMELTYDVDKCASRFFKDGAMRFTDGSGNVLAYDFKDCTPVVTFNGEEVAAAGEGADRNKARK